MARGAVVAAAKLYFASIDEWVCGGFMRDIAGELSEQFADLVIPVCYELSEKKREYVLSKQLLRAGNSIGANIREARYAQSRADFISKMSIALKEAGESEYWLKRLYNAGFLSAKQYRELHVLCVSLIKILTKIVNTAKRNRS